ncbi:MAG TPA: efflux RND transporter periplasmic adaptor subunit [Bryobacteraceae bacterium]|nr:efflux RND transporter periplasmic adaptor subunit [Bryobacteraceae bacterium]
MHRNLLVVVSLVVAAASCSRRIESPAETAIPVRIGPVHRMRAAQTVDVSGSVVPWRDPANVGFEVSGKVVEAAPREGDEVRAGQTLARIDPADYSLAVEAAEAQAAAARAALDKAEAPVRPEMLEQARISYERALDEYQRMKTLYDSRSLAPNDFHKFEAAYLAAEQQYAQAHAGGQKEDRAQARAMYDQAQAAAHLARKRLDDTTLRAPLSGFLSSRSVQVGEMTSPGRPVFQIVELDPVEISVGVPETDIPLVKPGEAATVDAPALPGERFEGRVSLVNVAADPATRTYMVRIRVPNPRHTLRLGMIAEARIRTGQMLDAMTLPGESLTHDPQGATAVFVYYPDQKRAYSRRVETGTVYGKEIEIKSGLNGDEILVLAGQERLRDGAAVSAAPEGR